MRPSWFYRLAKSRSQGSRRPGSQEGRQRCSILRLEALEGRLAPAVHVWTGAGTNNNWSDAGNWSGGTPAGDSSAILIFSGTQRTTNTNDLTGLTIQSITFFGPFTITGNAITLTGISDITTSASMSGGVNFGPNITLSGLPTITVVNPSASLILQGILSGPSGFTKDGDGSLIVQRPGTYTGTTTLTAGTLSPSGSLGTGTVALDGGTLALGADFTNPFMVGDNSHQGIIATISVAGLVHLRGDGVISQYGTLRVVNTNHVPISLYLDGNLSGGGALLLTYDKAQDRVVTITGNNSGYSGTVTVAGTVTVSNSNALGTGLLILEYELRNSAAFTLTNPFIVSDYAYFHADQNLTLTGTGLLTAGKALAVTGTAVVSLGALSGPGSLFRGDPNTPRDEGRLVLNRASTYSGQTIIFSGTLQLNVANALPSTTDVTVATYLDPEATLDLNNQNATIASLAGAGHVTLGTGTLTTGPADVTFPPVPSEAPFPVRAAW